MDSRQISCFLEAARCKSFTKAAKRLYVSQPTFSRTISQLEKELNLQLFYRDSFHGISLTESGTVMAKAFERTQAEIDAAIEQAQELERLREINLTLGLLEGQLLDDNLSAIFSQLRISHPNLSMRIQRGTYQTLMEALSVGEVDLVCMPDWQFRDTSRLEVIPYSQIETILAAPRRIVGTPEMRTYNITEFSHLTFVSVCEKECAYIQEMMDELFSSADMQPRVVLAKCLEEQLQMAEMGEGAVLINPYNYICYSPNVSCFTVAELKPQPFSFATLRGRQSEGVSLLRPLLNGCDNS